MTPLTLLQPHRVAFYGGPLDGESVVYTRLTNTPPPFALHFRNATYHKTEAHTEAGALIYAWPKTWPGNEPNG